MNALESLPAQVSQEIKRIPLLHDRLFEIMPVNALNREAEELLWHQRLFHGGDHMYKDLHTHVDGIPDLS